MIDDEPEFPSPSIVDSRRLLGANLYNAHPGALLEVASDDDALLRAWEAHASRLATTLGWGEPELGVRRERQGASLFMTAPIDVLMTATDVNEQAWVAAESRNGSDDRTVQRLRAAADAERATRPNFAAVVAAAATKAISVNFDDESLCVGSGAGSRIWPFGALPPVTDIPWGDLRDVPIALVTGSNGKTTTTRLVAAMWRAAGRVSGWCCSDGVWVDDDQLDSGDYSGPAGAREVVRHPRVEAAVLETARGGMLRRGLAVTRASAAIITNISADHFGEYGIDSLDELAEVKAIVARVLAPGGRLVLNADDEHLVSLAAVILMRAQRAEDLLDPVILMRAQRAEDLLFRGSPRSISWFSTTSENALVNAHIAAGGDAAKVVDGRMVLHTNDAWHDIGNVADMPLTLRGAAPHNVANLLGACLVGAAMGVPVSAIRETANTFGALATDNPGRLQVWRFSGVTVLTDYAHNPDGIAALSKTAAAMPATRRLLILGQAGNRDDELLRALPRAAFEISHFDRVVIKEMTTMLRGRAPGEIPRILADELSRLGVPADRVEIAPSEIAAVRAALSWARDGDLLVCPVHVSKAEVFALLRQLHDSGWHPGAAMPTQTKLSP